ncbi:efflux transporter outer membrane subunit [Paraburkholderia sp.]|uniref:efflux transporter outer membrane subunit n=1 Tax=Paraburkholderia sp. TaxID=1926495 RepID=UPI003D6EBE34
MRTWLLRLRPIAVSMLLVPMLVACIDDGTARHAVALHVPKADALANSTRTTHTDASSNATTNDWPTTNWVASFGDPQLVALVDETCANSPDIDIANARIAAAQAQLETFGAASGLGGTVAANALKARLPRVDGAANVNYAGTTIPIDLFSDPWVSPASVIGAAHYDLDLWGRNRAITRSLVAERDAARVDAQQARLALVTTLVTLYGQLDADYASRDLVVQKQQDEQRRDAILQNRMTRGLDTGYDAQTARARQADLALQLQQADDTITQVRLQIGVLTGNGPERGLKLTRPAFAASGATALPLPANLPLDLLGRRPDIVAARLRVAAAEGRIDAARARFYPNIDLIGAAGFSSLNIGSLFSSSSALFAIGPALSLPIFERPQLRAQLHGDQANADAMIGLYNKTLDTALGEVARSIATVRSADAQITLQEQAVAARTRVAWIADERHKRGLLPEEQVLSARLALADEQLRLVSLHAQRRDAKIALIRALGGGFDYDIKENHGHA